MLFVNGRTQAGRGAMNELFNRDVRLGSSMITQVWSGTIVDARDVSTRQRKGHLMRHRAAVHGEGVTWHHCGREGCEYKAKDGGNLKRHTLKKGQYFHF